VEIVEVSTSKKKANAFMLGPYGRRATFGPKFSVSNLFYFSIGKSVFSLDKDRYYFVTIAQKEAVSKRNLTL